MHRRALMSFVEKINFSSFLRKWRCVAAMFVVAVGCVCGAWATDYTWTGSGSDTNWTTVDNWGGSGYPKSGDTAYIPGTSATTITIDESVTTGDVIFNTSSDSSITIDTNGKTLTTANFYLNYATGNGTCASNIKITGAGEVIVEGTFDFPNKRTHTVTIDTSATLKITSTYYGNANTDTAKPPLGYLKFLGSGTLYVPASGANLNWGKSVITYASTLTILPYGDPTTYQMSVSGLSDFPGTNTSKKNITITLKREGEGDSSVSCEYIISDVVGTNVFKLAETTSSFSLGTAAGSYTFKVSCDAPDYVTTGQGFTITIKTPDGALVLGTVSYYKGVTTWTGATSTAWNESKNWTSGVPSSTANVTINSGVTNYPVISSDVTIKSLSITSNANVSMTGGTLTTNSITCTGNSKFTATDGTVDFNSSSSTWSADYPTYSTFYNVVIDSGATLAPTKDMYVAGSWENKNSSSGFTHGSKAVYFTGTGTVISNGSPFYDVYVNSSGTVSLGDAMTVAGALNITSGIFDIANLNVAVSDAFTNNGTLRLTGASSQTVTATGTVTHGDNSTIEYYGGGASTLVTTSAMPSATGYKKLSVTGASTVLTLTKDITAVSVAVGDGATIAVGSNTLSFGSYSGSGTITSAGGTITQTGSSASTISTLTLAASTSNTVNGGSGGIVITNAVSNALTTTGLVTLKGTELTALTVSSGTLTANGNITISGALSNSGTIALAVNTLSFKTYSGASDKITTTSGTITASGDGGTISNLAVTTGVTLNGGSGANGIVVSNITNSVDVTSIGTVSIPCGTFGALVVGDGTNDSVLSFTGDSPKSITSSSLEVKIKATLSDSSLSATVSGNITNNGTLALGAVTLSTTGDNIITGTTTADNTKFSSLTKEITSAATLTINNAIAVTGNLVLKGTNAASLSVTGNSGSSITLSSSQINGQYLTVADTPVPSISGGTFTAYNSTVATSGIENGWNIISGDLVYVWNGSSSTTWATAANWNTGIVPDDSSIAVEIPGNLSNYPIVSTASRNVKSLTIDSGSTKNGQITLSSTYNLVVADGSISNSGTIIYSNSGRITNSLSLAINDISDTNKGTVEYQTGTGAITDFGDTDYYNLIVTSGTWTDGDAISVSHDLTVSGGTLSINAGTGSQSSTAGTISLTGGTVSFGNDASDTFTVGSDGISVPSAMTAVSGAGTLTATSSTISILHDITLNNDLTFASAVVLGADSVRFSGGTYTATFKNTVGGATAKNLIIGTETTALTNAVFEVTTGGSGALLSSVTVYGTTGFGVSTGSAVTITTTGTQTYTGDVTLNQNTILLAGIKTVTFGGTVSGSKSLTIGENANKTNVVFGNDTSDYVNQITALYVFGNARFNSQVGNTNALGSIEIDGTTSINTSSIKTTGAQTYTGAITLVTAPTFSGTNILFSNTVSGSGIDLTLVPTTSAKFGSTIGASGTPIGALTSTGAGSVEFDDAVYAESININGATTIKTAVVKTTNAQTYTSEVTLAAAPTITAGSGVVFNSTVDGAFDLTFASSTAVTFTGAVGSLTPILDLTIVGVTSFDNSFAQTTDSTFTISSGTVTFGTAKFTCGTLSIASGASFTQTGVNANTDVQSIQAIENNGSCTWDSGVQGGSLILNGSVTGTNAASVTFNKKNVTIGATATISGVFYDLTIPFPYTVTNGNGIRVQRNLSIESGGSYTNNSSILTLGGAGSDNGTITDSNTIKNNLGSVTITQGTTTKTFSTDITAGAVTMSDTTSSAGAITFTGKLTASSITNVGSTNFAIALNGGCNISAGVTFNTSGAVSLGSDDADSCEFAGDVTHTTGATKLAGTLSTTDDVVTFGALTLAANSVINTVSSSGGTISITSIDGSTNKYNLQLISGVSVTTVSGVVSNLGTLSLQQNEITSTGTISFEGNVTTEAVTTYGQAYDVSFTGSSNSVTTSAVTFANTGTLTIGNDADDAFAFTAGVTATVPSSKSITGKITAASGDINFGTSATTVSATTTLDGSLSGALTLAAVTLGTDVTLNLGASGDSNTVTVGDVTPASTGNGSIVITNSGAVSFDGNIGTSSLYLGTLTLTMSDGSVTFADGKEVYVTTLSTSSASYSITANSSVFYINASSTTTFNNTGTLTLGDDPDDAFTFAAGVTATAPSSKSVAGTITATTGDIDFGTSATTATTVITLTASGGNITTAALSSSGNITLTATSGNGTITTGGNVSTTSGNIKLDGNVVLPVDASDATQITNVKYSVSGSSDSITVTGTIDGTTKDIQGLEVATDAGSVLLEKAIGSNMSLHHLYINTKQTTTFTIPKISGVFYALGITTCGPITQNSNSDGALSGKNLYVKTLNDTAGSAPIKLNNSYNDFDGIILATLNSAGDKAVVSAITYTDSDGFAIVSDSTFIDSDLGGICSAGIITLTSKNTDANGTPTSGVTQSGSITGAGSLLLLGSCTYTLNNTSNNVESFAASTTNNISYTDSDAFEITTIDSTSGVTATGDVILVATSGTLTISQPVSSGGNIAFTSSGNTILNYSTAAVVSNTSASGTVTFNSSVALSAASSVTSKGNISFASTINGANDLTLSTSGDISVTDAVGNSTSVDDITITTAANVNFNSSVKAASFTQSTGSGTTSFAGTVTLTGAFNFKGAKLSLSGAVVAPTGFTSGTTTTANTGTFTSGTSANITTTGTAISIAHSGEVSVGATLSTGATSAGDITVNSTGGAVTVSRSVTSGTGAITIFGTSSTSAVTISGALESTAGVVDIDSASTLNISNKITTTSGNVTIDSSSTATLTSGSGITTSGSSGTGSVIFGANKTGDVSLACNITTNAAVVTFTHNVTIANGTTGVTIATSNGAVTFSENVLGANTKQDALTVNAGAGNVIFTGTIGTNALYLGAITIKSAANVAGDNTTIPTTDTGAIYAASLTQNAGSGTTKLGAVTTTGAVSLTGTNQCLDGAVNAGSSVTLTGSNQEVNGAITAVGVYVYPSTGTIITSNADIVSSGSVVFGDGTTSYAGLITTAGDITTSSNTVTINNAVVLSGDVNIKTTSSGTGAAVVFASTVDGTNNLSIDSGAESVTFKDAVGATKLSSLTSSGTGTVVIDGLSISTTGAQSYTGPVIIGNSNGVTLTSSVASGVQAITFSSTVNSSSGKNYALVISTSGNTTFNDTVGNVAKLLTLSVGGTTSVNTSAITTTGAQTYTGKVTVLTSTTLTAKNASDVNQVITFSGSFDGGSTAVNLVGTVTFGTTSTNTTSSIGALTITGDTTNNSTLSSLTSTASVAITGIVTNNGVLNCGAGTITIVGNTTNAGTVNGGTSAISLTGDFTNNGTLSYGTSGTGTFTLTENFTNNGTFTCGKSTVIFTGLSSDNTSEITGKNTFYNLTLDTSSLTTAKTVVFPAGTSNEQTVNGKFKVSGNETNKIILTSSTEQTSPATASASDRDTWWYISTQAPSTTVEVTNAEIRYAYSGKDISGCVSSSTDYIVGNSWTTYHWFGSHKYYWIGTSNDNAWKTAGNWYSDSSGTNQMSAYPLQNDETAEVVIVKGDVSTSVSGNQLVLTSSDSSQIILKSFTLNSGVRADISSHKISAVKSITNNGILAIDGSNASPLDDSTTVYNPTVTHANSDTDGYSTIEYYSTNTSGITNATTYAGLGLSSSDSYVNLIINVPENATYSDTVNDVVKVSKDFTVVNSCTVSAKEISVTGDSSIKGGAVTTTGDQLFTEKVTLGGNEEFIANSGSGTITIVTSVSSATANGNVKFNGNVVLANTDATPTVSILSGTGTIKFDKTVTGSGQALALTSNSTTVPAVLFSGVVGESNTYLGAITSSGAVEFDSAVYASSVDVTGATAINTSTITTSGTQKYTGAVTLDVVTITLKGTTVEFVSTVDNATALTVTGNAVFGGKVGDNANLTSLYVSGTSSLNGASVATTGTQTYNGDATLGVNTTMLAGTSTAKFNSNVSGVFALTIGNDSNATDAIFGTNETDSVNGVTSLKVFGDSTFNSLVGNSAQLSSIEVALTTLINSSSITTTGAQTYTGAVTFGTTLALSSLSSGSGDILFDSTVDGGTAATTDVLISSTGNVTFTGAVGGTSLKSLTVGTSTNYATLININGGSVITSGAQKYYGPVSLGAATDESFTANSGSTISFLSILTGNTKNVTFNNANVSATGEVSSIVNLTAGADAAFENTVTSSGVIVVTGAASYSGNVSAASLEDKSTTIFVKAITVTTSSTQKYDGNTTLKESTTLLAGTNTVTFGGTVGGGYSLTIGSSTNATDVLFGDSETDYVNDITALTVYGNATFKGIVGNTTALGTINVELTSVLNTSSIATTGTQTYNGDATLGTDTTLLAGTSTVIFNSNVIGASHSLSVGNNANATDVSFGTDENDSVNAITTLSIFGDSTFNSLVGNTTAIGTIAVSLTLKINTSSIKTTGAQTYSDAVTLLKTSAISAGTTETAGVLFGSTVDGAFDLSFINSTFVKFNGAVGLTSAIKNLTTTGATYFENDFIQNLLSTFAITSGSVNVGSNRFVCGALNISADSTFTQTGANDKATSSVVEDNFQSVQSITNNGTCVWDSGSNGGFLTINGNIGGTNDSLILFNKKNVTVGASITLSGVFYNLVIPTGLTVINGSGICVRNDFTINGTYKENGKLLTLGWIKVGSTTYVSGDTGIISDNGSVVSSLGTVKVVQGTTSKTFNTAITTSSIDMSDSAATGTITFNGSLIAAILTNGSSSVATTFDILLNANASVANAAVFYTTGAVTLGNGGSTEDSISFTKGITHEKGLTNIACALYTTDSNVVFGSSSSGIVLTGATIISTNGTSSTTGAVAFNGAISNATSYVLTVDSKVGTVIFNEAVGNDSVELGDLQVSSSTSIAANKTISSSKVTLTGGAVDLNGTVKATNGFTSTGTTFDSTGASIVTTDSAITITHTADENIGASLSSGNGNICLSSNSTIEILAAVNSTAGNVLVDSDSVTTISPSGDITTSTGNVTFGSVKAGTLSTAGDITTSGVAENGTGAVTFTNVTTLTDSVNISTCAESSAGGFVLFKSDVLASVSYAPSFVVNSGSGTVDFNSNFGPSVSTALGAVFVTGGNVNVHSEANSSFVKSFIVKQSGIYHQDSGSSIVTQNNFAQKNGSTEGTSSNLIAGTISSVTGISFASTTYFDNTTLLDGSTYAVAFGKDVHVALPIGEVLKIASTLSPGMTVANNFILYIGTFRPNTSVSVAGDMVLLGDGSGAKTALTEYSDKDSVTGINSLYSYANIGRNTGSVKGSQTTAAINASLSSTFPDGSLMPTSYSGIFDMTNFEGRVITCGKNFYDNGVDLICTSQWTFKIPANNNAYDYFAETYNMSVKNSLVLVNTAVTSSGTIAKISASENCKDEGNNTDGDYANNTSNNVGWDFTHLSIKKVATVNDDILCITFTEPVENSNGEVTTALTQIFYDNGAKIFAGVYSDASCSTALGTGDTDTIYLKTTDGESYRWNTDATGLTSGNEESTDKGRSEIPAAHRSVVPNIQITKATEAIYNTLRDAAKNRIYNFVGDPSDAANANLTEGARYTGTVDNCSPVLVAVYTGQELHTDYDSTVGATSQAEYDSHNFIEFQYSESVNIGNIPAVSTDTISYSDVKNIQSSTSFDSLTEHGGSIADNGSGITVTGFANIASGEVTAGERTLNGTTYTGKESTTVHSLYRKFSTTAQSTADDIVQTHRVRVSIAGFVDGTVTSSDNYLYKNWNGYITSATMPSGQITRVANNFITDIAVELDGTAINNSLDSSGNYNSLPTLDVNSYDVLMGADANSNTSLYGTWDVLHPVFAPYVDGTDNNKWETDGDDSDRVYEIVGTVNNSTSAYLQRVEFHIFDNYQSYSSSDVYQWRTRNGWVNGTTLIKEVPDVIGGSRLFTQDENVSSKNQTTGGIRYSSLYLANSAFTYKYHLNSVSDIRSFGQGQIEQKVRSSIYRNEDQTSADTKNDGLYISIPLNDKDTELTSRTSFIITYDPQYSFITDMAGNRLLETDNNSSTKKLTSIDVTPPAFTMTMAPVSQNKIYVVFSEQLCYEGNAISASTDSDIMNKIAEQFEFASSKNGNIDDDTYSDLSVDSAKFERGNADYTGLLLTLNKNVTFENVKDLWLRIKKGDSVVTGIDGVANYPTLIEDSYRNCMDYHSCHALSDFALNVVKPIYAYDITDSDLGTTDESASLHTVHDFSGDGTNDNRLLTDKDIMMQVQVVGGTDSSGESIETTDKAIIFFDRSIDSGSASDLYNKQTDSELKVWLPTALEALATNKNTPENAAGLSENSVDEKSNLLRYYLIPDADSNDSFNWKANDVVQFMFGLTDSTGAAITIDQDGDSSTEKVPLYALRLSNEDDPSSVDIWQFRMVTEKLQRGGVTILNNVINPTNDEETVIQVDSNAGNLIVAVMTLDGNIIKYLEHGNVTEGTHYYRWNGTNNAGKAVARGLYFVRVIGEGIDETRKVMVVK